MQRFSFLRPFVLTLLTAVGGTTGAMADRFEVASQPVAATVFPNLAHVVRTASVDLPAGLHQVVLTGLPTSTNLETLQISLSGAEIVSTALNRQAGTLLQDKPPAVIAAEAEVQQIKDQIAAVKAAADTERARAKAAKLSLQFLGQLGANEGLAGTTADTLQAMANVVSIEAQKANETVVAAEHAAQKTEQQLPPLQEALEQAKRRLTLITQEQRERQFVVADVRVQTAGAQDVKLSYYTDGAAAWAATYALHLTTGDTPKLRLERGVLVRQYTGENWRDVALTLSTAAPNAQSAPAFLPSLHHRIQGAGASLSRKYSATADLGALAAPAIVAETAEAGWNATTEAAVLRYELAHPVRVPTGSGVVTFDMDTLETDVRQHAEAVPLLDEVAYRVVTLENGFGERLMGAQDAQFYVDGALTAVMDFTPLAAGATGELGFGPIHGLTLARDVLRQNEGDRGVISRSNLLEQDVVITAENLTGQSWSLRLLDRVPYSEQEDLNITWSARPAPDETDVDNRRGILAWQFELPAKGRQTITLQTSLRWPDGMELR